jgi:hypothetical protein
LALKENSSTYAIPIEGFKEKVPDSGLELKYICTDTNEIELFSETHDNKNEYVEEG